ncbi:MAG: STAS domain-containing protein [Burkholderiaceae bacterium]|nr:STAS domain-containing protein [Burkholderiaceae bacterium]
MAKEENGGLLSKVVRFVRNPATNWADLDRADSDQDSNHSKLMLKELVERKRRNDFVRKREFEMLRKLRRKELVGTQTPAQRPSFFQSSLPSKPDERAQTLKKIDEIEAQMSMQWWKTKHRDSSVNSSVFPPSSPPSQPETPQEARERSMLGPLFAPAPTPASVQAPAPVPKLNQHLAPAPASAAGAAVPAPVPAAAAADKAAASKGAVGKAFDTTGGDFSASRSMAIEVDEIAHDPELEEASIRFANGDDQGAEAGLLDALSSNDAAGKPRSDQVEAWLALFDLYRATGQQARFDVAAIDFANQFQRSAPQWFSMPEMFNQLADAQPAAGASQSAHWTCPPLLNLKSVGMLGDVLGRTAPPWRLDWTRLTTMDGAALPVLTSLFRDWAGQAVEIRMVGTEHLLNLLEQNTPSGERSVETEWWHTRMSLLRCLNQMDDFEMTALNYCVTYEVSPPSWEDPRCTCKVLGVRGVDDTGPASILSALDDSAPSAGDSSPNDFRPTGLESIMLPPVVVELSGSIAGDVLPLLDKLGHRFAGADTLNISCAKLIRVDFAAAGTLLNWVSSRQAEGRQVQFLDVHRLIAGFFSVIGISEVARVVVRTD